MINNVILNASLEPISEIASNGAIVAAIHDPVRVSRRDNALHVIGVHEHIEETANRHDVVFAEILLPEINEAPVPIE